MAHKKDFNYRLTEFFLTKTRLTILSLFLLVALGIFATVSLKTVGFPNPEIKLALVNTPYPGADAGTVLTSVTEPVQRAVKDVEGVNSYSSTTRDSFSSVFVTIDSGEEAATVRSAIQDAVAEVELPAEVETPKVIAPEIGGADVYLSLYQPDPAKRYTATRELIDFVESLDGTESVEQENEFSQKVVLTLKPDELTSRGLTQADVERAITTTGEQLPVVSGVTLDETEQSLITTLPGEQTLETLPDLTLYYTPAAATAQFPPNPAATPAVGPDASAVESVTLGELATISQEYAFEQPGQSLVGLRGDSGEAKVVEVASLAIKTTADIDQSAYYQDIKDYLQDEADYVFTDSTLPETTSTVVIENYTVAQDNERQVSEVLGGLLGSPLPVDNEVLAQAGWLLGGIQLVFLVMLAFVSWRAAIIAAASIPLSLVFTNIYLFFIGENLNTLVLFSFVLVIGLVVDPALVILESIQRKIDAGLRGKQAALAAVRDVGLGLFLATLTNIIVFSPFGIVTGVFGQIIGNIPLTIIPAVIGSYLVPLVFLAWFGSVFMRPGKYTTNDEVANLWGVARGLIRLNKAILRSGWWVRAGIIVLGLVLAGVVTSAAFGSGAVRSVQFANGDDVPLMNVQTELVAGLSETEEAEAIETLTRILASQDEVTQVFGSDQFGLLAIMDEERTETTRAVAERVNAEVADNEILSKAFLDIQADVQANGPPAPLYQVAIAVKDQDLEVIQEASLKVGETLETICEVDGTFVVDDCAGEESIVAKVDNGYTGRTTPVLNYVLSREALAQNNLLSPQGPASILVNSALRENFPVSTTREALTSLEVGEDEQDLFVRTGDTDATTQAEVDDTTLRSLQGQNTSLNEVLAEVTTEDSQSAISQASGETVNTVQLRLKSDYSDQATAAQVTTAIAEYYAENDYERTKELGLAEDSVVGFEEGDSAEFLEGFSQLLLALVLAIIFSYFVLAAFFDSLTEPLTILYTIPLTFIGVFPAVAFLSNGQFGFLEIIGVIILVGLVENVAIFLIDNANQLVHEGADPKEAIATASGIRLRPVVLTNLTAIASLAPLAFLSETYRPLSLVIIFGLLTSGIVSLITTPILYIFFRWLSRQYRSSHWLNKILFFPFFPLYVIYWGLRGEENSLEEKVYLGNRTYGGTPIESKPNTPAKTNDDQFFDHQTNIDFENIKKITTEKD